jgi:hypothetical protein
MKAKLLNIAADGVLYVAASAAMIGISLVLSEMLITVQKLHW